MIKRQQVITCDKCGRKETVTFTHEERFALKETGFEHIGITEDISQGPEYTVDLCNACYAKLLEYLNIRK